MTPENDPATVEARVPTWIEALESGDYEQSTGALYDGAGYCCFGVADKVIFCETFYPATGQRGDVWKDSTGDGGMLESRKLSALGLEAEATGADLAAFGALLGRHCSQLYAEGVTEGLYAEESVSGEKPTRSQLLARVNDAGVPFADIASYIRSSGWFEVLPRKAQS